MSKQSEAIDEALRSVAEDGEIVTAWALVTEITSSELEAEGATLVNLQVASGQGMPLTVGLLESAKVLALQGNLTAED